jgi:hypothetical protein
MMSRILSCSHHKHRTERALLRCIWGSYVIGEGKWGWRCNEGNRVFLYATKDEAEQSLEGHVDKCGALSLLQVHLR